MAKDSIFDLADKFGVSSPLGNWIQEAPDPVRTGGIFGYSSMLTATAGNLFNRLLSSNTVWNHYLRRTFVNKLVGDNLDSSTNGIYSNVMLEFQLDAVSENLLGLTRIEFSSDNVKWSGLETIPASVSNPYLKVVILLNTKHLKGYNGVDTVVHEVVLHGEGKAKMINDFLIKKTTLNTLKSEYAKILAQGENNKGHRELVRKSNTAFNAINDETIRIFDQVWPTANVIIEQYKELTYLLMPNTKTFDSEFKYKFVIPWSMMYAIHLELQRNSYSNEIGGQLMDDYRAQDARIEWPVFTGTRIKN
jgi:hypothetical protein